ncbi:MAG: hypothetical protein D3904_10860 [Candidatus Electrothrix sp. EH2]|nr:hypothetical protein [Candidatus Electrothrix sp. EH2]
MASLTLSLDENWESFLVESLSKALDAQENPSEWKFAVLNLIHSVEICFKALLAEEHRSLIYVDPGKPKRTISIEQAIQRLEVVLEVKFSREELGLINKMRDWRNQIIHAEFDLNAVEVRSLYAALLAFLSYFQAKKAEWSLESSVDEKLWLQAKSLFQHKEDIERLARKRIQSDNLDTSTVWLCRHCACNFFLPNESICAACGHSEYIVECDNCGKQIYVDDVEFLNADYRDFIHACSSCAARFDPADFGNFE